MHVTLNLDSTAVVQPDVVLLDIDHSTDVLVNRVTQPTNVYT